MADWATVVLEIGLLFCVWNVSAFRGGLALLVFFHLGVLLTMNISFLHQIFVYALFVGWENILPINQRSKETSALPDFVKEWHVPVFVVGVALGFYYVGSPVFLINRIVPIDTGVSPTTLILMLGAAIFTGGMVVHKVFFLQR
jgi:membrane glycosyltransferase